MDIDLGERVVRVDDGLAFYKSLTRLQAVIRGARVRRHLQETRRQFEAVFREVEERTSLQLTWPRELLCAPVLSYPMCSKPSKKHRAPSSSCDDNTSQSQSVTSNRQNDDSVSGTQLSRLCSCCAGHHVVPHELGPSSGIDDVATRKVTDSEGNSNVCNLKENCVTGTDVSNIQTKPTHDSCEVDSRLVDESQIQNNAKHHPQDSELKSGQHLGCMRTEPPLDVASVDVVDGEEPSHDTDMFRHKNVFGAEEGCKEQDAPPGRGEGCTRDDSIARNTSSVWDSFDGSTFRETRESLEGEDRKCLEEKKSNITMELLWIQQAIESRKQYLRLKTRMAQTAS